MIEIKIGQQTFQAAPLSLVEYKHMVKIFADAQRDGLAGNVQCLASYYEALLEIICVAVRRAGSEVDPEEISRVATPWEILKAAGELMKQSSMGDTPVIRKPN